MFTFQVDENEILRIYPLSNDAIIPTRGTKGSVGLDLYSACDVILDQNKMTCINTDLSILPPNGYYCHLFSRSGLTMSNIIVCAGVMDVDYKGNYKVVLHNFNDNKVLIKKHQKIAQLVCLKYQSFDTRIISEKEYQDVVSERGDRGFGSTDGAMV
jgi:dUTP pyrophosphatase